VVSLPGDDIATLHTARLLKRPDTGSIKHPYQSRADAIRGLSIVDLRYGLLRSGAWREQPKLPQAGCQSTGGRACRLGTKGHEGTDRVCASFDALA